MGPWQPNAFDAGIFIGACCLIAIGLWPMGVGMLIGASIGKVVSVLIIRRWF